VGCANDDIPSSCVVLEPEPVYQTSLESVVNQILADMNEHEKEELTKTPKIDLARYYYDWGTATGKRLGLWSGNKMLLESVCGSMKCYPDDASMLIIESVWNRLNNRPLRGKEKIEEFDPEVVKKVMEVNEKSRVMEIDNKNL